jgi:hypothetical protein
MAQAHRCDQQQVAIVRKFTKQGLRTRQRLRVSTLLVKLP